MDLTQARIVITGKLQHDVVPEYPVEAIREALINAICHRNYTDPGTIQVRIYDDRLEIWNPGLLPPDLTIEQLYHEHASHPRNPRLASAFHRVGLIERWGTGTIRIINLSLAHGLSRPEFAAETGVFKVRFFPIAVKAKEEGLQLETRLQQALEFIRNRGSISITEYSELFRISRRQAQRNLAQFVKNGILRTDGKRSAIIFLLPTDNEEGIES